MAADTQTDLVVIGGGPGGYVAAIRAAQLGLSVILIEETHLGGICLNWGCIPTKALLRSAEIYSYMQHAEEFGLKCVEAHFDLKKIVERSRKIAGQLSGGVRHLLKKNKVTVIEGSARLAGSTRLTGSGRVTIIKDGKEIADLIAKQIIIASGARARTVPGIMEPDGKLIWSYREAMIPETLPDSLLIVGSGAIGIEFASFYRILGVDVTVVEVMERILPVEDAEISTLAQKSFEKQGIKFLTGSTVKSLEKSNNSVTATIATADGEKKLTMDRVIMAIGIIGNTESLGLEGTDIVVDRGHIVTDPWMRTGEANIYAIGDVCGPPWLAHKASHEAIICIEKLTDQPNVQPLHKNRIPGCTYCQPQIASIGLTEARALEAGYDKLRIGRFPFIGNGKAIALGETEGLIKTIFDAKTGELLGAHMIGSEVTELIQGYAVAMSLETTEAELIHTIFPHPTLSEMMHESVLAAYGHAIHI